MSYSWESKPDHYFGYWPGEEGMIPVLGRSAASDILEESNFNAALERLNGVAETLTDEEPETGWIMVHRASHWAVGWVESLWVADSTRLVEEVMSIRAALEDYPVLNEEDFYRREWEDLSETLEDATRDAIRSLDADDYCDEEQVREYVAEQVSNDGQWCRSDDVDWSYVEELVQGYIYDRAWDDAHREHLNRHPLQVKGQLPLWVLG